MEYFGRIIEAFRVQIRVQIRVRLRVWGSIHLLWECVGRIVEAVSVRRM